MKTKKSILAKRRREEKASDDKVKRVRKRLKEHEAERTSIIDTRSDFGSIMTAVEWGWKQYEKGNNLEMALKNARDLYGPRVVSPRVVGIESANDVCTVTLQRMPLVRIELKIVRYARMGTLLAVRGMDAPIVLHLNNDQLLVDSR